MNNSKLLSLDDLASSKFLSDPKKIIEFLKKKNESLTFTESGGEFDAILKELTDSEKLELMKLLSNKFIELYPEYKKVYEDIKNEIQANSNKVTRFSGELVTQTLETISNNLFAFWSIILGLRILGQNKFNINIFNEIKIKYEGKSEFFNLSKLLDKLDDFFSKKSK